MHYEEKIINGVLMCRYMPDADWKQVPIDIMSSRIVNQAERIVELEDALAELYENQDGPLFEDHPLLAKEGIK